MFNAPWMRNLFSNSQYRSSKRRSSRRTSRRSSHEWVTCYVSGEALEERLVLSATIGNNIGVGDQLQNYRIAIAATAEYTAYFGSQAAALAAIQTTVAELNEIFERELAIHFDLVSGTNVIFTDTSTDGYSNGSTNTMIGQNTPILNSIIGVGNYDIGHVFGTVSGGGSGLAGLGVVNNSNWKGRGVSLSSSPIGTNFVNLVAHEIGHQFNAEHTFNANAYGSTRGNRSADSAYEPASGSTLMSYAGIASDGSGDDNLQDQENDYFHSASFEEIQVFVSGSGSPNSTTPTGNNIPTISAGSDYTIPAGTTFQLIASASDSDASDTLTYTWEQFDLGPAMSLPLFDNGSSPLFRSFEPTTDPSRTFPLLDDVINNVNTAALGEVLPTTNRDVNFRATVRDGHGGVNSDDVLLTVVDTGSTFRLTNTNSGTSWTGGQSQTITWDVAGTNANGINTTDVAIELSTDGGYTYEFVLAASTANDGSFTFDVPNIDIAQARVRVRAIGNIFFDISDADFSVNSNTSLPGVTITETGGSTLIGEEGVVGSSTVDTYSLALNTSPAGPVDVTVTADAQTQVSLDGVSFVSNLVLSLSDTSPQTIYVRGLDDSVEEGIHTGLITHSVSTSSDPNYFVGMSINSVRTTIADDELQPVIGVDFDNSGSSPDNWTTVPESFSSNDFNLIREDGVISSVDLNISVSGGANVGSTSAPSNLPEHSPSLSGLDGVRLAVNSITLTWSDLVPSTEYDLYLFLSEPYVQDSIQTVTITGGGTNPAPFVMDNTQVGSDLLVNSEIASPMNQLEDYAVRATANSSGQIVITVANTGGDYVFLSGAAIQAVAPSGTAPQAINDSYTVDEDNTLTIPSAGVLGNDTDTEGDSLTATLLDGPTHGALILNPDGSFTYTPNENFNGVDTFTYKANDGSFDSNPATVTITVNATNDAPVAQDDAISTSEDMSVVIPVLDNDSDIDGDEIRVTSVNTPSNGSAVVNLDGTITYTPGLNFHGVDTFTYTVSDTNNQTHTGTVTVTVDPLNDQPVAEDDSASTDEDTSVDIAVLTNDSDVDGDTLSVQTTSSPAHGVAVISGNGTITYTPNANFYGSDEFTYTISDANGGSHTATVNVNVNAVNDAPIAVDDSYSLDEDGTLSVAVAGVLVNDTDAEDDSLTSTVVGGPSHGVLTLNTDGSFTYTPNDNYNGTDTFTYQANDGNADSNTATVTITVNPINDAPVANDDSSSTDEDNPVTIDLLANDTDLDGNSLNVQIETGPSNGSVLLNPDQTVTYTPAPNFHGTDSFTYLITDGDKTDTATATVTVLPINDAPTAVDDTTATNEDEFVVVSVLGNDSDIDGDSPTLSSVTDPTNGSVAINPEGTITYTPNPNFEGSDTFTYTIVDGNGQSSTATVSVTVNAVNDPPVATDDAASTDEDTSVDITVLGNDTDIDADTLSVVSASDPANGTTVINVNGTITYTPDSDFNGSDTFTYTIEDGKGASTTATVTVTVNPVGDAPSATDDSYSVDEDTQLTVPADGLLGNDLDVDGDSLTTVLVSEPANGTLMLNADGSFSYLPNEHFNGADSFTYYANDGNANSNTATVTITVNAVNDAPDAGDDSFSIDEDSTLTVPATGVLLNDADIDGNPLTAVLTDGPANGVLTLNADGSFTYTPDENFNGTDSFVYQAHDGNTTSNLATVTITVNAINDAPIAADDTITTDEDVAINIPVLNNDTDIDADMLSVESTTMPDNGSVVVNANGTITYTPDADFHGSDSFGYTIKDTSGQSSTATVNVAVNPTNDAPTASDEIATTNEDTSIDIAVLVNDADIDGDQLSIAEVTAASNGSVMINLNGTINYTPDSNFHGTDTFTYTINDGNGKTNSATVTVIVNPVNDAPVAMDDITSTDEDTPVDIFVLPNDSDIDGNTLEVDSVGNPANGSAVVNANGSITYTPNADFHGIDTFTYVIRDGNTGMHSATVTVTVDPVNDDPVADDDAVHTDEDSPIVVLVLDNDSDIDGDSLTVDSLSTPSHGSAVINANGSITYTPSLNFNGTDTFTYTISDGAGRTDTASVTVAVAPVNDNPTALDDTVSTNEDTSIDVIVLSNDVDLDGDSVTVAFVTNPTNGMTIVNDDNTITYVANPNFHGSDSFSYTIVDGNGGSASAAVTVTVRPTNDPPIANEDVATTDEDSAVDIFVLSNDTDIDGDSLLVSILTEPIYGSTSVGVNGVISYTPNVNYYGGDTFSYQIDDGKGEISSTTVTLTVNPLNDPPVAQDDSAKTKEGTPVIVDVLGNDSDVDDDMPNVLSVGEADFGTTELNLDGTITYTPNVDFHGSDTFTYVIGDGQGGTATGTVSIVVSPTQNESIVTLSLTELDGGNTVNSTPVFGEEPVVLHEWQTVGGYLWLTIDEAFDSTTIDLIIDIGSSTELVEDPTIVEHIGQTAEVQSTITDASRTTYLTITGISLAGTQVGDHVYLGALAFAPNTTNLAGLSSGNSGEYAQIESDLGFSIDAAQTGDDIPLAFQPEVAGSMAPVIYDTSDNGRIGLADFAQLIRYYGDDADMNQPEAFRYDFDRSGKVSLQDFALFIRYYGRRKPSQAEIELPGLTNTLVTQSSQSFAGAGSISLLDVPQLESEPGEITLTNHAELMPIEESLDFRPVPLTLPSPEPFKPLSNNSAEADSTSQTQQSLRIDHSPHSSLYPDASWKPQLVDEAVQDDEVFDFSERTIEQDEEDESFLAAIWITE